MYINNKDIILKSEIARLISDSDEIIVASPFITANDELISLLNNDIKFSLIFRLSYPASPDFLSKLLHFQDTNKSNKIYFYDDSSLHSKIYLFRKKNRSFSAIIGSSNFTSSGIERNKEFNILVKDNLKEIENYLNFLIAKSEGLLNESIIDDYRLKYKAPAKEVRYKKNLLNSKWIEEYEFALERYNILKGLLHKYNTTDLPFTYIFDYFSHICKTKLMKSNELKDPISFDEKLIIRYFNNFLQNYIDKDEIQYRKNRLKLSNKLLKNIDKASSDDIKEFYLGIHSISSGSGSGIRIDNIEKIDSEKLKNQLKFFINSDLSMSQNYAIALTERENNGKKIRYVGESAVGEIPGWLQPEKYPIINRKLITVFDFLKV